MDGKGNISTYLKVKSLQFIRTVKKVPPYNNNIHAFCEAGSKGEILVDILRKLPYTALLQEPFGLKGGCVNPFLNLGHRPYIPEGIEWDEAKREFTHLLSGNKLTEDMLSGCSLRQFIRSKQLIVRVGNGNAILPWLTQKLNFITPPIYWLRHPIPTCLEQLDRGMTLSPEEWGSPKSEFSDYWEKHRSFLQQLKSPLECQLAQWCLHNQPALHALNPSRFTQVCYEDFLLNGSQELHRVFERMNLPVAPHLLNEIYTPPDSPLGTWKYKISKTEKERAQRVLDYFSIDLYSTNSPYPVHKEVRRQSAASFEDFTALNYPMYSNPV